VDAWLTRAYSTDWKDSLYVGIYPINADGSEVVEKYLEQLEHRHFESIERFLASELERYGKDLKRPVRIVLGERVYEQPPALGPEPNLLDIVLWSMRMRLWAGSATEGKERYRPDVRIFLRYHSTDNPVPLENSVGIEKGMFGIVNAYASRRLAEQNNVIIAHEFLHTLGATDKYEPGTGQPLVPIGIAEPDRSPLYPQRIAEIMGGRIAMSPEEAIIPKSLDYVTIGPLTAAEIRLAD
jgi:hypothetical protein